MSGLFPVPPELAADNPVKWRRPRYTRRDWERGIDALHWVRLDSRFGTGTEGARRPCSATADFAVATAVKAQDVRQRTLVDVVSAQVCKTLDCNNALPEVGHFHVRQIRTDSRPHHHPSLAAVSHAIHPRPVRRAALSSTPLGSANLPRSMTAVGAAARRPVSGGY
jgi:hypothetical protein